MTFRLRHADTTLKLFITAYLITLTTGYAIGLLFVDHSTELTSAGIQEQFLGNEENPSARELRYAKSANEMFIFLHNHILSLAMVFCSVGVIFYFSSGSEALRRLLIVEPLVAVLTTFGGIALTRYVSPYFSWLVLVSGTSMVICYVAMVALILKELWVSRRRQKPA